MVLLTGTHTVMGTLVLIRLGLSHMQFAWGLLTIL